MIIKSIRLQDICAYNFMPSSKNEVHVHCKFCLSINHFSRYAPLSWILIKSIINTMYKVTQRAFTSFIPYIHFSYAMFMYPNSPFENSSYLSKLSRLQGLIVPKWLTRTDKHRYGEKERYSRWKLLAQGLLHRR